MPKTALVIDDEPDVVTYHSTLLSDHGWRVLSALSGDEGFDLAKKDKPDIVLLDVMMPDRGGLSTLIKFRKDDGLKSVPVILVTGVQETVKSDYKAFLDRFKTYNPDAYIEKPIDPDVLLKTMNELTS
jgi:CheY-like chemotaxis protein